MKPLLLLDCYLSDSECPRNFVPPGVEYVRIRAAHVDPETIPVEAADFTGIVVTGSAASVLEERPWSLCIEALLRSAHRESTPVLGVCYGHQLLAKALLGSHAVRRSPTPEIGWHEIEITEATGPLADLPPHFTCFLSHFDEVVAPAAPAGGSGGSNRELRVLARSSDCAVQALEFPGRPIWGVQFHAEMDPEEARNLFLRRVTTSPELGIDADRMLARATANLDLWCSIYRRFLAWVPTKGAPPRVTRE